MTLDALATRTNYADHLAPLWDALGRPGRLMGTPDSLAHPAMAERGALRVQRGSGPMLVASWTDLHRGRSQGYGPFVLMQHGAGQSYHGDRRSEGSHSYAGARDHEDVRLFVVPGPDPARRWRDAYPEADVVMAGNIKPLPDRVRDGRGCIAVTFHWPASICPEMGSAWPEYREAVARLALRWRLIGRWHPRWGDVLRDWYRAIDVEPVASLDEVALRSDVLVADNTSALYEYAATGRPVVVLNSEKYRRDVKHGLRFWEAAGVGINVDDPLDLGASLAAALADHPALRAAREDALALVYAGSLADAVEAVGRVM